MNAKPKQKCISLYILQIYIELTSDFYLTNRWLDPEDSLCNPDQYFKQISYYIDLTEIYDYIDTCYFNDDMKYCPVIVKLTQDRIKECFDNCTFLIQVWNKDTQRKTFEKAIKKDEPNIINIVDLDTNKSMRIKNLATDIQVKHLGLSGNYLYVASDYEVQILYLENICTTDDQLIDISSGGQKYRCIKTKLKVLGLVFNGLANTQKFQPVAFETSDNQIQYTKLVLNDFTDDSKFNYKWQVIREVTPRHSSYKNDPVIKFKFVYVNGYCYAATLRQSGDFDLYWNFMHKCDVSGKNMQDISMSFGSFYFKTKFNQIYRLDHQNSASINFDQSIELSQNEVDYSKIYLKMIQTIVKPFVGFNILRTNNTGTIIVLAHAKFISIYDILNQKWVHHCQYEDEILYLFRHYLTDKDRYQAVLLKNGAIYVGVINNDLLVPNVPTNKRQVKFGGSILRISQDIENNQYLYILVKESNKIRLDALVRGKIQNIKEVNNLTENLSIVQFQTRGDQTKVLFHQEKSMTLYSQSIKENTLVLDELNNFNNIADKFKNVLHSGCSYDIGKHMFLFDKQNMYVVLIKDRNHVIRTYENIFCCGIQTITNQFNYALCQETASSTCPGLRYFDMELIIQKDKPMMTLLKKIDVGTLGYFEQGVTIERLGFLNSINSLVVTPILHRNVIRYMGMKPAADYKIFNAVNGKFLALIDQQIQTYCQFTGKYESTYEIPKHILDMSKLISADRKKYGRVLFATSENLQIDNPNQYFFDWQMTQTMDKVVTFEEAEEKNFKKYYYIELLGPKELKIHMEFVHPHYKYQRIFFNKDMTKMVSILLNYRTFVYKKFNTNPSDETQFKWQPIRGIKSYPNELDNEPKFLEFFSPCFSRYLTVDKKLRQFIVRNVDDDSEVLKVPQEIMMPDQKTDHIKHATNRIQWLDVSTIRICNPEGVEMIFDMDNNFKRLAFNKIPLFDQISGAEWQTHHIYKERPSLGSDQLRERLKRRYQSYKSRYFMSENLNVDELLYELFHRDIISAQYSESSLTFVHWSLINQLKNDIITLDDLSPGVIETLLYNILPGGKTILHEIHDKKEQMQQLLEICHKDDKISVHIPFLANFEGQTPIHLMINKKNYRGVNTVLQYLSYYDIDHHSRWIKDLYSVFIKQELPNFLQYINSRFQQTKQIQAIERGPLKEDHPDSFITQLWYKNDIIDNTLFDQSDNAHVSNIKIQYIDMPGFYHCLSNDFKNFFTELSETKNYAYFENKAIQSIIDFNYPLIKKRIIQLIVYPFAIFHLCFVIYANFFYEQGEQTDRLLITDLVFSLVLIGFSLYFIVYEMTQMKQDTDYFISIWNYIDLLAPVGVILFWILHFSERQGVEWSVEVMSTILSLTTFFMWLKILYILRIFKETGYLIRAIIEVVIDMRFFLLILFFTALTFGDSFLKLSMGNGPQSQFIDNFPHAVMFGYKMILGDFETDQFGDVNVPLAYIFFFLCTILDMIVMLNLLIALISDTYARVASNSKQAAYQEMAKLIEECMYLVPKQTKLTYAPQNQYILVVENLEKIDYSNEDPYLQKIQQALKKVQAELALETTKISKSLTTAMKDHADKIDGFKADLDEIKKLTRNGPVAKQVSASGVVADDSKYKLTKVHKHMLLKQTISQLKANFNVTSVRCDGRHLTGCKSGGGQQSNLAGEVCHCFTCGADYCPQCFDSYGHAHPMQKLKFSEISGLKKYQGNSNTWKCSAADYKGCSHGADKNFNQLNDIAYCCRTCDFDLCEQCAATYQV